MLSKDNNIKDNPRLKLTPEERKRSQQLKVVRTRIANMVARKPEIQKKCCICGNENAQILHNRLDPYNDKSIYMITFICRDCRNDADKLKQAEQKRFDVRSIMDKSKLSVKSYTDIDVKRIVDDYLNELLPIGEYCNKIGISRHLFNGLVKRYAKTFKMPNIKKTIDSHTNKLNRIKLSECAIKRNNF